MSIVFGTLAVLAWAFLCVFGWLFCCGAFLGLTYDSEFSGIAATIVMLSVFVLGCWLGS